MNINLKSPKKARNKVLGLSSRDRWNDRLTLVATKKEARRVWKEQAEDIATSAAHCGVSYSCFWNWLQGERRAPKGLLKK